MVILRPQDRWAISSCNTRLTIQGKSSKDILTADCLGDAALTVRAMGDHPDVLSSMLYFIGCEAGVRDWLERLEGLPLRDA